MKNTNTDMKSYYRQRADVYDRVYAYPERQDDLRFLENYIPSQFVERDVLEVAAGTGYWTQFIAAKARSVLATDASQEVLEHVQCRENQEQISTRQADAYSIGEIDKLFGGAFAGLWISHVPKQQLRQFVKSICVMVSKGSPIVFIDNSEAQCNRLPLTHTDTFGNTYQDRALDDGSIHRVMKNFPTEDELAAATEDCGKDHLFIQLENFWLFKFHAQSF